MWYDICNEWNFILSYILQCRLTHNPKDDAILAWNVTQDTFWFNVVFETRISHKHHVKYGIVQHGNWCAKDEIYNLNLTNFHQKIIFVTKVNKGMVRV